MVGFISNYSNNVLMH